MPRKAYTLTQGASHMKKDTIDQLVKIASACSKACKAMHDIMHKDANMMDDAERMAYFHASKAHEHIVECYRSLMQASEN